MLFVNLLSSVLTLKFITSWQAVLRRSKHPMPRVASFHDVLYARANNNVPLSTKWCTARRLWLRRRHRGGVLWEKHFSEIFPSSKARDLRAFAMIWSARALALHAVVVSHHHVSSFCNFFRENFGGKRVNLVLSDFNHLLGVGKQRFYVFWGFIIVLVGVWTNFWTGLKQNKWNELIRHSLCDSPAALSLVRLEPVYQLGRGLPMGWNVTTTEIFSHAFLSSVHIPSGLLCSYHCDSFAKYLMRS